MAVTELTEYLAVSRQLQVEDREFKTRLKQLEADNKLRLAEIRVVEKGRVEAQLARYAIIQRIALAVVKIAPLMIAVPLTILLIACGRTVPEFLQKFLEV